MSSQHPNSPASRPISAAVARRSVMDEEFGIKVFRRSERLLLAIGLICILVYLCTRIGAAAMYQAGLWSFSELKSGPPALKDKEDRHAVDFSLWSEKRVQAYKHALASRMGGPLAVLSIPRLRLEVPVFDGTGELTLNSGAGRITGTAGPGEPGNVGIAAHRDGFFRSLKDVRLGDRIELTQLHNEFVYTVDNIAVVDPSDVTVLKGRAQPSLTLVTCYPFYLIGDASQRYIVQASLTNSD